jgi:LysR family transcriptional regulator, glycine cleavage system transcriptional activator
MTSRHYRLPSLHTLATFEASARHLSMKRAADELNVTSGAVSRQIKALEDDLGVALFNRVPSGLTLTTQGEVLYSVLCNAFGRLGETIGSIRLGGRQNEVTIACTHAFAKCWLMPRMSEFWREHPDVCVNHLISDDGRGYRRSEVDLRIRYGFGAWPDETAHKLFEDVLYPVAAPSFADRHAGAVAADLPKLPLLHVDWVDPDWTGWSELFRRANIPHSRLTGRRFSNFDVALQTCKDGLGVALGWHRLVADFISTGELVPFTSLTIPSPGAYYLTWNANLTLNDSAAQFRDWLLRQAAITTEPKTDPT